MMGAFIVVRDTPGKKPIGYVVQENGCWDWVGAQNKLGYGQITVRNPKGKWSKTPAARFLWEQEQGPVPRGLELDHLCRNPSCVRLDHLEPVTHKENLRRGKKPDNGNTKKTHCPKGHPYSGGNLYRYKTSRQCRICVRRNALAYYHRRKAVA